MKVELSEKAADAVKARLESGDYRSPEEVVEAAIRLLEERDEAYWASVRAKIADGDASIEAGRTVSHEQVMERARLLLQDKTRKTSA